MKLKLENQTLYMTNVKNLFKFYFKRKYINLNDELILTNIEQPDERNITFVIKVKPDYIYHPVDVPITLFTTTLFNDLFVVSNKILKENADSYKDKNFLFFSKDLNLLESKFYTYLTDLNKTTRVCLPGRNLCNKCLFYREYHRLHECGKYYFYFDDKSGIFHPRCIEVNTNGYCRAYIPLDGKMFKTLDSYLQEDPTNYKPVHYNTTNREVEDREIKNIESEICFFCEHAVDKSVWYGKCNRFKHTEHSPIDGSVIKKLSSRSDVRRSKKKCEYFEPN